MDNTFFSFLLTFLAGFSTMIGALVIFLKKKEHNKIILLSLSFAAGVMITISITDLVPESIFLLRDNLNNISTILLCFLGIILGVIISMLIDYYLPDKPLNEVKNKSLFKVGLISMIAIIMHNIPEGIVTFIVSNKDIMLGLSICIAIALHNIPEGISIAVPIYYSTGSKKKAIFYTFLAGLSEPIGAILTGLFLVNYVNDMILGLLFALIAGIMIQISSSKLLPTGNEYNKGYARIFFVIGFIVMLVSLFMMK